MKWLGVVGTREVNDTIRRDIEHFVGQKLPMVMELCRVALLVLITKRRGWRMNVVWKRHGFRYFCQWIWSYIAKHCIAERLAANVARMMRSRRSIFCETSPNIGQEYYAMLLILMKLTLIHFMRAIVKLLPWRTNWWRFGSIIVAARLLQLIKLNKKVFPSRCLTTPLIRMVY